MWTAFHLWTVDRWWTACVRFVLMLPAWSCIPLVPVLVQRVSVVYIMFTFVDSGRKCSSINPQLYSCMCISGRGYALRGEGSCHQGSTTRSGALCLRAILRRFFFLVYGVPCPAEMSNSGSGAWCKRSSLHPARKQGRWENRITSFWYGMEDSTGETNPRE
jgi:hypothetical protein